MTIRVLVADDQAMIRGALAGLLNLERDIEVVAQAADGVQALEELTRLQGTTLRSMQNRRVLHAQPLPLMSQLSTSKCLTWTASQQPKQFAPVSPGYAY